MRVSDFKKMRDRGEKITMLTCYDTAFAKLINQTSIDCILVGDSLAMAMHGHATTLPATIEMMAMHTAAVARGANKKFIVGDLPFLSYRKDLTTAMNAVERLMQEGAQAVKLEGVVGNVDLIKHIVDSGVPVMGHIGLTPQSVHQLGGYKVQGRCEQSAELLLQGAKQLEAAGCFAIVLECVPAHVAKTVTAALSIPTIGIGAGHATSGQVLVLQDLLGMDASSDFKFVKKYLNGAQLMKQAFEHYVQDVKAAKFPDQQTSFA